MASRVTSIAEAGFSGILTSPRLPFGKQNQYRQRKLQCERFVVERWDEREGHWLAVVIDDSPRRAFQEMRRITAACEGVTVCAHCEVILPAPSLEEDGRVVCADCFDNPGGPMPFRLAVVFGVSCAAVLCLFAAIYAKTHAGVNAWPW